MKTTVKLMVAGVVLWSLAQAAAGEGGVKLRYKPKAGELIYRTTTKINQTQNVMNKEIKNDISQTGVSVWSIGEADKDGNINTRSEVKFLEAKVKLGEQGEYTFDSRKNDNERGSLLGGALTPLYERLSSANLTFTITPTGKVLKLEGYKELVADLIKDNPLAAQFAGGGSDEIAKINISEFVAAFSEKPVNPGDRWETPFEKTLDKLGTLKGKKTYIYEGEGKVGGAKTVKIGMTSEMAFDLDLDMGAAKVTGKMSITESKGTLHFDPKRGCLVSLTNEYKLAGNLNVSAGGKDIPVTMDQTQQITIEILDKLPK